MRRLASTWLSRWDNSQLLRRLSALTSGTAIAQAIQLANLVALAQLYSLTDVGVYSVFIAIVSTIVPVALLGYEILIPATTDEDLTAYLRALLLLLLPITLLLAIAATLLSYSHLVGVSLWVAGAAIQRIGEMYNVRGNRFRLVVVAKLIGPLIMAGLLFSTVTLDQQDISDLIILQAVFTLAFGVAYTAFSMPLRRVLAHHSWGRVFASLRKSANGPLYLMPSNLLNLAAYNVPVLVVGHWFGSEMAAQYAYVLRFGFGPVGLIGGTLYQVFYGFLAEATRVNDEKMFSQFVRARRYIGYAALATGAGIGLIYPLAFLYILGQEWDIAGWISVIFAPFFAAMLYLTPLSVSLNVFSKQQYELKTQAHYLIISIISFGSAILSNNVWVGYVMFSLLGCVRYAILLRDVNNVLIEHKVLSR